MAPDIILGDFKYKDTIAFVMSRFNAYFRLFTETDEPEAQEDESDDAPPTLGVDVNDGVGANDVFGGS